LIPLSRERNGRETPNFVKIKLGGGSRGERAVNKMLASIQDKRADTEVVGEKYDELLNDARALPSQALIATSSNF